MSKKHPPLPLRTPQKYQPKIPISICLIGKNEAKNVPELHRTLQAILGHPEDEVLLVDTGSTDATVQEAHRRGWRVVFFPDVCSLEYEKLAEQYFPDMDWQQHTKHPHYAGKLIRSFAEARQRSFDEARNDWCLWLDLDDSLDNPEHLRPAIDQLFADGQPGVMMLQYDYAFEKDGSCVTTLWRERLLHRQHFYWAGACHETCIPRNGTAHLKMVRIANFPTKVRHRAHKGHKFSDLRNYLILREDLAAHHDPRTLYYLGNACRGLERTKEARKWYEAFIPQSGNKDDVFSAQLGIAAALAHEGRFWKALEWAAQAQRTNPSDPRGYYFAAQYWYGLRNWKNVLRYIQLGDTLEMPDTFHAVDPTTVNFHPAVMGAIASRELNLPEQAIAFAQRAAQERPNDPEAQASAKDMEAWARAEHIANMTLQVAQMSGNPKAALAHLRLSPHLLERGIGLPEQGIAVLPGTGKSIAFFCGVSAEPWGPPSMQTGIGASEKMVVWMAQELAKRGHRVTVYATLNCAPGLYNGVEWRWSANFNPSWHRDVVFVWRAPQHLPMLKLNADRVYVWMHDVGSNAVWTPEVTALCDKVLFLSEFHRSLHPALPDEQVYLTRNGIDPALCKWDGAPKEKKIIYASSPDRGWLSAIETFRGSDLAKEGWKLNLFYGFGKTWQVIAAEREFGNVVELACDTSLYEYQDRCLAACDGQSVINRGRVGWDVMAKEFSSAALWLYPTRFDEISCVAAMEAMAAGTVAVATPHAALAETLAGYPAWVCLDPGAPMDWPEQLREAAHACHAWDPAALSKGACDKFNVATLAEEWERDLL